MSCKSPHQEPRSTLVSIRPRPTRAHWKSVEERRGQGGGARGEFPGGLPGTGTGSASGAVSDTTRRDFLSLMGFSMAAAGAVGCRAPVQHAVPLPAGSDTIVPGVANVYATTCGGCPASCSLLVKQRDGRPIKVDGNDASALFGGGTCATGQATVLSLYDDARLRGPQWQGQPVEWQEVDRRVIEHLGRAKAAGGKIVLLSSTVTSPSTQQIIADFGRRFPTFRHVTYDGLSLSAMRAANAQCFGQAAVPHYAFDQARVIVALEADFLGTWLSPVEFARQYAAARRPESSPTLHVQIESGLSITGTNADVRIPVAPSDLGAAAVALLSRLARKAGGYAPLAAPSLGTAEDEKLDATAGALWEHRGQSLVVSGSADTSVQTVVAGINVLLGNVGKTLDLARPSLQRQGDDGAMAELVEEMSRGEIAALILYRVNPAYDYPEAPRFLAGLQKVPLSISFSDRRDETSSEVHAICPDHHFLEAWGDAEPVQSSFSLQQPLIAPLHGTRAAQETLLRWQGAPVVDSYTYLRDYWRTAVFSRQKGLPAFDEAWDRTLERGVLVIAPAAPLRQPAFKGDWKSAAGRILDACKDAEAAHRDDRYELHLYESVALRDGGHANNPWLQELPDPVSKVTWANYAALSPRLAEKLAVHEGDVVTLTADGAAVELPIFVQPGQHPRTISVALGYGRRQAGKAGDGVGVNVFPLRRVAKGPACVPPLAVTAAKAGRRAPLATTQRHFSMEGRPIALETTREELEEPAEKEKLPDLWAARLTGEHSWGMAIDLNACTGCSACVVSCNAENNVPVVGKDQVQRSRIMHWMRLDHYYSGSEDDPSSVHQPMMCQHCLHAPCETVCPVLATTTSSEGLNQQVYNRCIGTRYCANNCPYKVRRFNWYNYTENDDFAFNMRSPLGRMVLNPDVTVRSRGVMEKCSLCVQRIQLAKNTALKERRALVDGDIQTACQQSCPTGAIVFGDLKDPESRVSRLMAGTRSLRVLEELGTRPNVGYLKKVRNNGQET